MKPIGLDPASGLIVIAGNGVFPARSLTAMNSVAWPNRIQIDDLAGNGVQSVAWTDVTSLDGTYAPQSMTDALAYLQIVFSRGAPARVVPALYTLNRAASFSVSHGLSYAPTTTILDANGTEIDTDVIHTPGQTVLMFASPFTGTLYLG